MKLFSILQKNPREYGIRIFTLKYLIIRNLVTPVDANNEEKAEKVEPVQFALMSYVGRSCFTDIQEVTDNTCFVQCYIS